MFAVIPAKEGIQRLAVSVAPRLRGGDGIRSSKKCLDSLEARRQHINLLLGIVERQGGPHGGGHSEAVHDRLGAVVAGADRNTLPLIF